MDAVERDVILPAAPEEVWELLTRPEELATWLGDEVVLDPVPGAPGRVVERDAIRHLVVEEVREDQLLIWRWWQEGDDPDEAASRVAITLTPVEGGTAVRVVERPLTPTARASARPTGEAWSHRLLHLESLLLVAAAVRGG